MGRSCAASEVPLWGYYLTVGLTAAAGRAIMMVMTINNESAEQGTIGLHPESERSRDQIFGFAAGAIRSQQGGLRWAS